MALAVYGDRQAMVTIKGVDDNFDQLTHIREILFGDGQYELHAADLDYGILGIRLAEQLGTGYRFYNPLYIYAPRREGQVDLTDPTDGFVSEELFSLGVLFSVQQAKYDKSYILTSIGFARRIFDQQQDETFRIMKVEKLIAYLFLTFILMVACFNIIGSLSMLIVDKRDDVVTLRNLGAYDKQITQIFLFEGRMISALGAVIGIAIGLLLCWIQQTFGVIALGSSAGSFIVDAYPVSVHYSDVLLVFVTVLVVGFLSAWYPVRFMITPGDIDDRKPLDHKAFVEFLYGKLVGDKGYIGKELFQHLFVGGIQLITKLKSNMRGAIMTMSDRLLTRKRAIIETINDELKNIAQVEHSRHRSFDNFIVNILGVLAAYCFFPKKPCIACERAIDNQLTLF